MDNQAVCLPRFGDADVLRVETIDTPHPSDDQVLAKIAAASVNPVDFKTRESRFPPVPHGALPIILGRDLAGIIEAVCEQASPGLRKGHLRGEMVLSL